MSDIKIIKEIEKELKIILPKLDKINIFNYGYTRDEQGNVTGVGLRDTEIRNLQIIISILRLLPQITVLDLSGNQINDLTPLKRLTQITDLRLFGNQITDITPLRELKQLRALDLRNNQVSDISPLKALAQIATLDLRDNRVSDLTPLTALTKLNYLDLSSNQIIDISPLKELTRLSTLDLGFNQINSIHPLKELTQLINLNLWNNRISDLSPLSELKKITTLYLAGNRLKDLSSLKELSKITVLDLGENEISDLKPLENLTQISELSVGINQVDDLSPLKGLKAITKLGLPNNKINNLLPLKELTQITELILSQNEINDLSPLKNLKKITTLWLSANQIKQLDAIEELTEITDLSLESNMIRDLSPLENLSELKKLNLSHNQINDLASLKNLKKITTLDVQGNLIKKLPSWVSEYDCDIIWNDGHSYKGLNLYGNPLQTPPPEIIQQGKVAVKNYFAQLFEQKRDYLFEAKMLIVGEPGAGKTSLAWKIEDPYCELPKEEETTRGIEVKEYCFPLSKTDFANLKNPKQLEGREFRLNLWDFGGQEIYKATHRFFLSKRSLYALVADSRNEDTDFNYWLNIVEMFGGDSPLLIVLNEKHQRKRALDISAMRARFPNIVGVIDVDLAEDNKARLHQLTQTIRHYVSRLPHIGSPVPAKWAVVREALENNKHNTISLQDYLEICKENNITKTQDALVLSQYFHDIGVFLHFQDDHLLKNRLFLNSTWATQAVYQILDHPLLNKNDGRFTREDAKEIWKAEEFELMRGELLQLMKKFFLTYEIENTGEFIVPERLRPSRPNYNWPKTDNLILQYKYDFFMPKGILSQFIVQMNRYIRDHKMVWKRGVVLIRKGAVAEITESYDARTIQIKIVGRNRRDFITIITEKIDELNAQYEKMVVEKLIPCNCAECKASEKPYFYKYQDLKRRIAKNRREVECGRSYEMINVRNLIDDVINEDMHQADVNFSHATQIRKKVFISYSHKDKKWLQKVQTHLKVLEHLGIEVNLWDDTHLKAGNKWYTEITNALAETKVAILLVSTDFLASDFITKDEFPPLLKAAKEEGATILPLIIKPSLFGDFKELSAFQAINDPATPLSTMSEPEQDKILVALTRRIKELVD